MKRLLENKRVSVAFGVANPPGGEGAKAKVVLHVEDSDDDAYLFAREIKRVSPELLLRHLDNGAEAVKYLSGSGPFANRSQFPIPELLLLDINLPGLSGFDVLAWARAQPAFRQLPIWILSSSGLEEDVQRARQLGADRYLVKAPDFHRTAEAVSHGLELT